MRTKRNDILEHHGIKGQEWGVKHGPPYPLNKSESARIKAGSKIGHITTDKKLKLDNRGIYGFDQNNEIDSDVYRGAYGTYLSMTRSSKLYEHTFETKEDLLIPSYDEKVKAFEELYSKDTNFKADVDFIDAMYPKKDPYEQYSKYVEEAMKARKEGKIKTNADVDKIRAKYGITNELEGNMERYQQGYDIRKSFEEWASACGTVKNMPYYLFMNNFMVSSKFKDSSDKFVSSLANKGYNAIIDDNNSGIYNGAQLPLYVFDASKTLAETSKATRLKDKERLKAQSRVKERNGGRILMSDFDSQEGEAL